MGLGGSNYSWVRASLENEMRRRSQRFPPVTSRAIFSIPPPSVLEERRGLRWVHMMEEGGLRYAGGGGGWYLNSSAAPGTV